MKKKSVLDKGWWKLRGQKIEKKTEKKEKPFYK